MSDKLSYEELEQMVKVLEYETHKRQLAEQALQETSGELTAVIEAIPDAIYFKDTQGRHLVVNRACEEQLGLEKEKILGKTVEQLLPPNLAEQCRRSDKEAIEKGKAVRFEEILTNDKGEKIFFETIKVSLFDDEGNVRGLVGVTRDITERRVAEEALRHREDILRAILTASPLGIGFFRGRILDFSNKVMHHMLGYEEGSLLGKSGRILYPNAEEYHCVGRELYAKINEAGLGQVEAQWITKDGRVIDCYLQGSPIDPSDPSKGTIVAALDITERKRAEQHIRSLSQQVMNAQETERQRLSRDLHDDVAQELSTVKIGLDTLFSNLPEVPHEKKQKVAELSKILLKTILSVREMSYNLRPSGLEQFGLVQTVFQYCQDFSTKHGVQTAFFSAGMESLQLDVDTVIAIYRLIQEALNNVKKHGHASKVTIRLIASHPNIILRIEDNGKGFDVRRRMLAAQSERHMGLRGMQERVNFLRGKIKIESAPMQGTKIFIKIPYEEKKGGKKENHPDC